MALFTLADSTQIAMNFTYICDYPNDLFAKLYFMEELDGVKFVHVPEKLDFRVEDRIIEHTKFEPQIIQIYIQENCKVRLGTRNEILSNN